MELSEADTSDVASLFARCSDYFLLQDGVASNLDDAKELFTDVPPEKNVRDQTVLGWRDGDGLYAVAAILRDYPLHRTWYLGFMIVDASRRGSGIGRSIYAQIENWTAARGASEIRLAVLEVNEAGERFWRSRGFHELRRVGPDTFKMRSHRRVEFGRRVNSAEAGVAVDSCRSLSPTQAIYGASDIDKQTTAFGVRTQAPKRPL
ncbi:GNAT family N-acetyltransferase [Novosphingobium capsulatum]|nr:GNAT family N-acetyltransferase [Novosphingobium capsulatum]WQD91397.1 GNAT family N-acetyltransferase [Novosphingobium capsulatum]